MKITQRPHKFCFSKNPVQYTFAVPEYSAAGCGVLIRIYKRDIGGGGEEMLYEESIKPLTSSVIYNIADITEAALTYDLPDFAGGIIQAGINIKEFYVKFSVVTDAAPTPLWIDDSADALNIVKGGIPAPLWDWNNYFINRVVNKKPFLTWQPDNRFVGRDNPFFISFLNSLAGVPISLAVDAEYTDGTTSQVVTDFADSDQLLYHIKADADSFSLNSVAGKKLYKYSLSIVATSDHSVVFAKPVTYYIDYRQFYNTKCLHYYNSLGGIEMVRMNGETENTAEVAFTDSERYEGAVIIGSPASEQYLQTAKSKFDSFKGNSGYLYTVVEHDVFQELLLTRFAWERIKSIGQNWRIFSLNKSTRIRSTSDKVRSFALEWRYSFTNTVYAPLIDMGVGADQDSYCQKVQLPSPVAVLPDGIKGVAYSSSFSITGDSPITLGTVTKPSWMTVAISGKTVTFSGTPDTEGTDIAVSVEFLNCATSVVTFIGTIDVVCVGISGIISFPEGEIGTAYSYTIPLIGATPFTLSGITAPSWMTLTVSGSDILVTGTPDTEGTDIPVIFTINSCTTLEVSTTMDVTMACEAYYNNTSGSINITYTPCGTGETPVTIDVTPGGSVCGHDFSGGWGYLIYLGNC